MKKKNKKSKAFLVLKLTKKISVQTWGAETEVELGGCLGYAPIFRTLEEAEKHSDGGKFLILPIEVSET